MPKNKSNKKRKNNSHHSKTPPKKQKIQELAQPNFKYGINADIYFEIISEDTKVCKVVPMHKKLLEEKFDFFGALFDKKSNWYVAGEPKKLNEMKLVSNDYVEEYFKSCYENFKLPNNKLMLAYFAFYDDYFQRKEPLIDPTNILVSKENIFTIYRLISSKRTECLELFKKIANDINFSKHINENANNDKSRNLANFVKLPLANFLELNFVCQPQRTKKNWLSEEKETLKKFKDEKIKEYKEEIKAAKKQMIPLSREEKAKKREIIKHSKPPKEESDWVYWHAMIKMQLTYLKHTDPLNIVTVIMASNYEFVPKNEKFNFFHELSKDIPHSVFKDIYLRIFGASENKIYKPKDTKKLKKIKAKQERKRVKQQNKDKDEKEENGGSKSKKRRKSREGEMRDDENDRRREDERRVRPAGDEREVVRDQPRARARANPFAVDLPIDDIEVGNQNRDGEDRRDNVRRAVRENVEEMMARLRREIGEIDARMEDRDPDEI